MCIVSFSPFWLYVVCSWSGNLLLITNYTNYIYIRLIGLVGRMFANSPGDLASTLCHVIPKISKMVLDTSLLNTQQYKVRSKGKVEQYGEKSGSLPYTSM